MTKFFDIESPACDAVCAASILLDLIHEHFSESHERTTGSDQKFYLSHQERDNLLFAAGQVSWFTKKTKEAFYTACETEHKGSVK